MVPSSTIGTPLPAFCSASFLVGSSRPSPLRNTTSAVLSSSATLGLGSKVWELVPSGTMPRTTARSPAMDWTMLVIGETVVATVSFAVDEEDEPAPPAHAVSVSARRAVTARRTGPR